MGRVCLDRTARTPRFMGTQLSLLWTWNRTIDRVHYVVTGVVLFALKFAIDWVLATQLFAKPWSPLHYLIWPNDRTLKILQLADDDRVFAIVMLAVSLP